MRVCFIRHGPDVLDQRYPHDEKLDQRKIARVRRAGHETCSRSGVPKKIYASPLKRTKETADEFAKVIKEQFQRTVDVESLPELSRYSGADSSKSKLSPESLSNGAIPVDDPYEFRKNLKAALKKIYDRHAEDETKQQQQQDPGEDKQGDSRDGLNLPNTDNKVVWCVTHGSFIRELYKLLRGGSNKLRSGEDHVRALKVLQIEIRNKDGDIVELKPTRRDRAGQAQDELFKKADQARSRSRRHQQTSRTPTSSHTHGHSQSNSQEARRCPHHHPPGPKSGRGPAGLPTDIFAPLLALGRGQNVPSRGKLRPSNHQHHPAHGSEHRGHGGGSQGGSRYPQPVQRVGNDFYGSSRRPRSPGPDPYDNYPTTHHNHYDHHYGPPPGPPQRYGPQYSGDRKSVV